MGYSFTEHFKPQLTKMKTAVIVLLAVVAVAQAYYQKSDKNQLEASQCFPDRCLACQNHFGDQLATFDCEGQCGLCALCNAATLSIVPGCAHCKDGIDACIDVCKKGQKICSACSSHCGL